MLIIWGSIVDYVDYANTVVVHYANNNKLMLVEGEYKSSCAQVFFGIAVLKNSQGSRESISISIYKRFIFLVDNTE